VRAPWTPRWELLRLVQELFPHTIVMDDEQIEADGLTMEIVEDEALLNAHGLEKL
jgi:hypothetical protein